MQGFVFAENCIQYRAKKMENMKHEKAKDIKIHIPQETQRPC